MAPLLFGVYSLLCTTAQLLIRTDKATVKSFQQLFPPEPIVLLRWAIEGGHLTLCKQLVAELESPEEFYEARDYLKSHALPGLPPYGWSLKETLHKSSRLLLFDVVNSENEEMLEWFIEYLQLDFTTQPKLPSFHIEPLLSDEEGCSSTHITGIHALMRACELGSIPMARVLLDHGVKARQAEKNRARHIPHALNRKDKSLSWVLRTNPNASQWKKYSEMIEWAEVEGSMPVPLSPLNHACKRGDIELARLLLDRGAPAEFIHQEVSRTPNFTPLWIAAHFGHLDIVRLLVSRGASPTTSCKGGFGWSEAFYNGHTEVLN